MSVDLPEPEGPMMAVKVWRGNGTVTPSRATTSLSPDPYTLRASATRAATSVVVETMVGTLLVVALCTMSLPAGRLQERQLQPQCDAASSGRPSLLSSDSGDADLVALGARSGELRVGVAVQRMQHATNDAPVDRAYH